MRTAFRPTLAHAFCGLLLSCACARAEGVSAPLSDAQVDRALDAIWLKAADPEQRSPDSAKRAALEAYLTRLGPGTALVTKAETAPLAESEFPPLRFHSEVLPGGTGYIRMGAFVPGLPGMLEPVLRDFAQMRTASLVLDLRATPAQGTLSLAAEVAACFLPANSHVFTVRSSHEPSVEVRTEKPALAVFRLVVLTGQRTGGPVEAFAGALRSCAGAAIVGVSTRGQAADFELVPLGKDTFLRLPVREALVSGAPGLNPDGLHPDIICTATPEATDAALLRAAADGKVAPLLKQTERPRLNEAALVAGVNPETEAWIQAQLRKGRPKPDPLPKDAALTMAVDFLTAWESLHGKNAPRP